MASQWRPLRARRVLPPSPPAFTARPRSPRALTSFHSSSGSPSYSPLPLGPPFPLPPSSVTSYTYAPAFPPPLLVHPTPPFFLLSLSSLSRVSPLPFVHHLPPPRTRATVLSHVQVTLISCATNLADQNWILAITAWSSRYSLYRWVVHEVPRTRSRRRETVFPSPCLSISHPYSSLSFRFCITGGSDGSGVHVRSKSLLPLLFRIEKNFEDFRNIFTSPLPLFFSLVRRTHSLRFSSRLC